MTLRIGKGLAFLGKPFTTLVTPTSRLPVFMVRPSDQSKRHFPSLTTGIKHRKSHKSLFHVSAKPRNQSLSPLFPSKPHQSNVASACCSLHTSSYSWKEATSLTRHQPTVQSQSGSLTVFLQDKPVDIPLLWLRDHCRCPLCFNKNTLQRKSDAHLMQRDVIPASVQMDESQGALTIEWKDNHVSTFSIEDLQEWLYPGSYRQHSKPFLWNRSGLAACGIPSVPYREHINTESGLKQTIANLATFGFTFVDETPVSLEATQAVSERVGKLMPTLYGEMWTLSSNSEDFKDTAYSNVPLGAHTDLTYYRAGAGIQIFHALKREGSGGETLLVDGFHAAQVLQEKYPESFDLLTSCVIPHEYREPASESSPGYHLYNLCHVLTTHPNSGELIQIRYNPYDRAPLNTLPTHQIQDFYTAYHRLADIIQDAANEFWVPLTPGRVIFIDNWRVMHGRAAFTGLRVLGGCYLQRDEWVSKARMLNVF